MRLAIILVSYNTRDLLRTCLHSVFAAAAESLDLEINVVVVDSASHDGSADMIAQEFPQVRLIRSDDNIGFTRGNNLALQALGLHTHPKPVLSKVEESKIPDFVLLLNPDTEIVGDALGQMARFLAENPDAGVCGAHLRYGDGQFQHGAFRFPSLAQVALDLLPLARVPLLHRLYDSPINGRFAQSQWQGATPFSVDFVLGAALMVRTDAITQVGGLDEGYFMYCEEMDLCLRIQEAGWQVYAHPAARVVHHEGQSSRQVPWQAFTWLWQSRIRFYTQHRQRYGSQHMFALQVLIWSALRWRTWRAYRRFAHGDITGVAFARELAAYGTVLKRLFP